MGRFGSRLTTNAGALLGFMYFYFSSLCCIFCTLVHGILSNRKGGDSVSCQRNIFSKQGLQNVAPHLVLRERVKQTCVGAGDGSYGPEAALDFSVSFFYLPVDPCILSLYTWTRSLCIHSYICSLLLFPHFIVYLLLHVSLYIFASLASILGPDFVNSFIDIRSIFTSSFYCLFTLPYAFVIY